jgi:hypothetical protein
MATTPASQSYARRHFGKATATPKVIAYYTMHGWQPIWDRSLRLTPDTCALVRERGGVTIRVRHRFRAVDVMIARYLGEQQVSRLG